MKISFVMIIAARAAFLVLGDIKNAANNKCKAGMM